MTVGGVSHLAGMKPAAHDSSATGASDGGDAFAAMMADAASPQSSLPGTPADDAKGGVSARDKSDGDAAGHDDKDSRKTQDDSDAALMAMLGVPVPLAAPADAAKVEHSTRPKADLALLEGSKQATAQQAMPTSPGAAKGDADRTAPAAEPDAVPTSAPLDETGATAGASAPSPRTSASSGDGIDPQQLFADLREQASANGEKSRPTGKAVASPGTTSASPSSAASAAIQPAQADPSVEPSASAAQMAGTAQAAMPVVLGPLPATAALMAARAATSKPATPAENAPASDKSRHEDGQADAGDLLSGTVAQAPVSTNATHAPTGMKVSTPAQVDNAGQILAAGTADRHLDLARQGAWLDGLARDIASVGGSSGTVRFQVSPEHLGTVQVELRHGDDGSAVTLTATNEASRIALADAQPQLIAEARAHGLHITSAQVDVGHGDGGSQRDSQQQSNSPQSDSLGHHTAQSGGFSSQTGGGSGTGQRSQTRSQLLPEYQSGTARTDRGGASDAPAPKSSVAADARYA